MHEYRLTLDIIDIAMKNVRNPLDKVKEIHLVIGESAGILGDCIRLYFQDIAKETICADAQIMIEWVKPMLQCNACGAFFVRKPFEFTCANTGCNGEGWPTKIGREFYVKSIVI